MEKIFKEVSDQLDNLSLKTNTMKHKMFFASEVTTEFETLAVKFDRREENAANWLSYEVSRTIEPFMSLLADVSDSLIETETVIEELILKLAKAKAGE